jgi:type IV secretory pathway VirB4 component
MFSRRSSGPLQDAGSCAEQIALLRFIDDITFETKLGDLGILLSFSGIDPDCRTDEVLNAFTRRYESAMRLFDDRFRVYSYIVKRSGATAPYREHYPTDSATAAVHRRVKALEARAGSRPVQMLKRLQNIGARTLVYPKVSVEVQPLSPMFQQVRSSFCQAASRRF